MKNISNKNTCFTIMPFSLEFDEVYSVIKSCEKNIGLRFIRSDDIFHTKEIMDVIFEEISHSKILIADVTGKNANVNYELGIAHALNKPVVLLTQNIEDVPFDYRHRKLITYDRNKENWQTPLKAKIYETIHETLKHPLESLVWVNKSNLINQQTKEFFLRTWTSGKCVLNKSGRIYCDNIGNCRIVQDQLVEPMTNFTHMYQEIYIDKPGIIEIISVKDNMYGSELPIVLRDKTERQLRFYILFKDMKSSNSKFSIRLEYKAENYLSDLFDFGKGIVFHKNSQGTSIKLGAKTELYIFEKNDRNRNIRAKYINHPNKSMEGKVIEPIVMEDTIHLNLDYSGGEYGDFVAEIYFN